MNTNEYEQVLAYGKNAVQTTRKESIIWNNEKYRGECKQPSKRKDLLTCKIKKLLGSSEKILCSRYVFSLSSFNEYPNKFLTASMIFFAVFPNS